MEDRLNKQEFLLYSRTYSSERAKIQRKGNVRGALMGVGSVVIIVIGFIVILVANGF